MLHALSRSLSTLAIAISFASVSACNLAPQQLLATLPAAAGGVDFDTVEVIDDSFLSGHVVDDVLTALGKRRGDAAVVFRGDSVGQATIGAMAVQGVEGQDLLDACVENWGAPAVIRRSQRVANGTDAWELEMRDGMITVFYARANTVFVVWSEQRQVLEAVLGDMP